MTPEFPAAATRLAIVLSHPTQYYSPWFQWMRAAGTISFRVLYLWDAGAQPAHDPEFRQTFAWDTDLVSGYDHEFILNTARTPGTDHFFGLQNPGLLSRLAAYRPTALLIFGYKSPSHLRTIAWARRHRVPLIFRGDSHLLGRGRLPFGSRLALRWLYARFQAFTYVGEANREYFGSLGVPPSRLFFAPHAVDANHFDPRNPGHQAAAVRLREDLRIAPQTRVVLFAGKLLPAKRPLELLQAFLATGAARATLLFVGDGAEKGRLMAAARAAAPGTVHFLPFANQRAMPSHYLAADIFALPSGGFYETWGLAVNEAMQMGLPCLVSDRVGCQRDLVTDNKTGWVVRADRPAELRTRLADALATDLSSFKSRIADRIQKYSYRATTTGVLAAIGHACSRQRAGSLT